MIQLPTEAFRISGSRGDKISLTIDDLCDFPQRVSGEGGYDFIGTLEINADCYAVKSMRCLSATGTLYRFCDELKRCCETDYGTAEYKMTLGNDLVFTVEMLANGRARVTGEYCEKPERSTALRFEFETDKSAFPEVIKNIEQLKEHFGGTEGKNNGEY